MRQYIRHPTDIPLEYRLLDIVDHTTEFLNDVSHGGLSFRSTIPLDPGARIEIRIPLREPKFDADGVVVWCNKEGDHYDVGVEFADKIDDFRVRMVEQVCHIEHYRMEVQEREGRLLTGDEAAREWITRNAGDFPS
jgi:hypothetical protein